MKANLSIPVLVLDVDGTLIHNDLTHELLVMSMRLSPAKVVGLFKLALLDKSKLKSVLVDKVGAEVLAINLPYNEKVIALAKGHKAAGGKVVLCSGSHQGIIDKIVTHFDWIDEGYGTTEGCNLTKQTKADFLCLKYPAGFEYVGNSSQDFPVWSVAQAGYAISPPKTISSVTTACDESVQILEVRKFPVSAALKGLRMHQWAKNILIILVPLLVVQTLGAKDIFNLFFGFFAMSLMASATYVLNDLIDIADDRAHLTKKNRPLASGALSVLMALGFVFAFLFASGLILTLLPKEFMGVLLIYLLVTIAYSFGLKRVAIVDVMTLAGLFTIRVIAGAVLVQQSISPWLFSFVATFFLSLALVKRYTELRKKPEEGKVLGRGYHKDDEPLILSFGMMATGMALLCFFLYGLLAEAPVIKGSVSVFALVSVLTFWLLRIWLLAHRKTLNDDPVLFAVKDKTSLVLGGIVAAIVLFEQLGSVWPFAF